MRIPLDREGDQPLYQQIEDFLREGILAGSLPPETQLPASRQLAKELGVNRLTVERAYADLEVDGLIYARMGSGTYTLPPPSLPPASTDEAGSPLPLWQSILQDNHAVTAPPTSDTLLHAAEQTFTIAFDGGTGDPRLFPVEEFRKLLQHVMRRDGLAALEYGDRRGYAPLRTTIAQVLTSQGLRAHPDHLLITSGSQQSLALIAQLLLDAGDTVLVENPTYSGALALFRSLKLKLVGVPMDEEGMQVEHVERLLQQHHPKLIYTMPTFHNPTGVCLSTARRRQLLALAALYNVPIVEDDFVGDLRYEGRAQPALKALDAGGNVIYISSFSKMLMPGLRIGFLLAEGPIYERLTHVKWLHDLASSNLIQHALATYVTIGRYQMHLRRSCRLYRKRRDAMLAALERYLPSEVRFTVPQGGLFIWLRLPEGLSSEAVLAAAHKAGVTAASGTNFFLDHSAGDPYLRLSFASVTPALIETGIQRLGQALQVVKNFAKK
ncbi:MAG: PLP-dependent aminotransferase family protein [Anaerolineae bacterium]|nr:PLP-dependent aminotransferase family protein [Anaerolineae bacterium]